MNIFCMHKPASQRTNTLYIHGRLQLLLPWTRRRRQIVNNCCMGVNKEFVRVAIRMSERLVWVSTDLWTRVWLSLTRCRLDSRRDRLLTSRPCSRSVIQSTSAIAASSHTSRSFAIPLPRQRHPTPPHPATYWHNHPQSSLSQHTLVDYTVRRCRSQSCVATQRRFVIGQDALSATTGDWLKCVTSSSSQEANNVGGSQSWPTASPTDDDFLPSLSLSMLSWPQKIL